MGRCHARCCGGGPTTCAACLALLPATLHLTDPHATIALAQCTSFDGSKHWIGCYLLTTTGSSTYGNCSSPSQIQTAVFYKLSCDPNASPWALMLEQHWGEACHPVGQSGTPLATTCNPTCDGVGYSWSSSGVIQQSASVDDQAGVRVCSATPTFRFTMAGALVNGTVTISA